MKAALVSLLAISWVAPVPASPVPASLEPADRSGSRRFVDGCCRPEGHDAIRARRPEVVERSRFAPPARTSDVDHVAVIEDDGSLVIAGVMVLERMIQEFTATHSDSFDLVAIFAGSSYPTNLQVVEGGFASAYSYAVRNSVTGIGLPIIDRNDTLGIDTQRLKNVLVMNDIPDYGASPGDTLNPAIGFTGTEIVAHEAGHMSISFVNIDQVVPGADIGGSGHWNVGLDGRASVMWGARWQDNLDGTFTVVQVADSFSQLDQYLLGLRPPADVDSMFTIDSGDVPGAGVVPIGTTVTSTRIDFSIDDVIAQNGTRDPPSSTAQHDFRVALALLIPYDTEPLPGDLDWMNAMRADIESWFFTHTDSLGTFDTTLPPEPVAAAFTSDVFAGNAPFTVRFQDHSHGAITGRTWDFGDGSPVSTGKDPEHTYTGGGSYTVTLTVDGLGGPVAEVKTGHVTVGGLRSLFADDFETDAGWAVGPPNDATTGNWERGDPEGTIKDGFEVQPEDDHTPGGGTMAWVTGLAAGGAPSANDVDGGTTTLYSPILDLSGAADPLVSYARWFSNNVGQRAAEEPLTVQVSNNSGGTWFDLEVVNVSGEKYRRTQHRLTDVVAPTAQMQFRFIAQDPGLPSLVEASLDDFEILDGDPTGAPSVPPTVAARLEAVRPNPFDARTTLRFRLDAPGEASVRIFDTAGRLVRTLTRGPHRSGEHVLVWDGTGNDARRVAGGVYFVRLDTASGGESRKAVVLR